MNMKAKNSSKIDKHIARIESDTLFKLNVRKKPIHNGIIIFKPQSTKYDKRVILKTILSLV